MSVKEMKKKKLIDACERKWYVDHKVMKVETKLNYNNGNKTLTTVACEGDHFFSLQ